MDLKCVMDELKSLKNEIKTISDTLMDSTNKLNDKIDRQTEKFVNWMHFLENKTTLRLVRIDETVRKSANSINVIVRLVAGAQNMNSNVLGQILIEAEALTNKVKSTTDINYEDIPNECSNVDFLASHIKDLIIKAAIFPSKNVNTGNPSFDPINTNIPSNIVTNSMIPQASSNISNISDDSSIPSTSTTNSMISQTSSIKNNMYQNQSSSNISNVSDNTNIPSTSATNSSILETSSIQNTMNQNHMSPNMFGLSTTRYENSSNDKTILNAMPYIDNINREKEKQEQEALRKKYRNKYKYLDKYKNINEKNSTKDEKNNIKKPHFIDNKFINANESNSTKSCIKAFNDCRPYRDPIFDGIEDVELIYIEEGDTDPRRVIKSLSDIQPRVLIDLIDANSAEITEIKKRLMNGESKSRQNNSSQISDEKINSNKPNRKNVAINKKIKNDKQKSETIVNVKNNKRKATMINNQSAPPKKRASFRKQSNMK